MLVVELQGLNDFSDVFSLPAQFSVELLPTAISHWLFQPLFGPFMTLGHVL
jgi:hypothetical protein